MNTQKQVLVMTALMLVTLIIVGIYGAWLPSRETAAEEHFAEQTATRGSILFARNCRLCHGDLGQGGLAGARLLAAPPLDRADLQGFIDAGTTLSGDLDATATTLSVGDGAKLKKGQTILIGTERLEVKKSEDDAITVRRGVGHTEAAGHRAGAAISILDAATLAGRETLITNTLTCGRVGTAMPAWAQSQGGPLSDEQIRQLTVLITTGRWDLVEEEIDIEDATGAVIGEDGLDGERPLVRLTDASVFTKGEAIRIGEERLRVKTLPPVDSEAEDKSGTIEVERGVLGTIPLGHGAGTAVFRFPEVSEPSINQSSCGQTARPSTPATPALIEPFEGQEVEISALGIAFSTDAISVAAGGQVRIRFDNQDEAPVEHNVAVYVSASDFTPVAEGSVGLIFPGPAVDDTVFDVPAAGSYFFRCDIHPTIMTGTFSVTP